MFKSHNRVLALICIVALGIHGLTSFLPAQEPDRTDPVAVANSFLTALRNDDFRSIVDLMPEEQRKEYTSIMEKNPKDIKRIFTKDKKKAGKVKKVSELRHMTTFSGKPGVAAKVKKKGREIYIIVLARDGDRYFYENSITVTKNLYKELTLIRKLK